MSAHRNLIQRLERAAEGEFSDDYSAQDLRALCSEALHTLKAAADEVEAAACAERSREAEYWASHVEHLSARLRESEARYSAMLQHLASRAALLPPAPVVLQVRG